MQVKIFDTDSHRHLCCAPFKHENPRIFSVLFTTKCFAFSFESELRSTEACKSKMKVIFVCSLLLILFTSISRNVFFSTENVQIAHVNDYEWQSDVDDTRIIIFKSCRCRFYLVHTCNEIRRYSSFRMKFLRFIYKEKQKQNITIWFLGR